MLGGETTAKVWHSKRNCVVPGRRRYSVCGIVAIYSPNAPIDEAALARATTSLGHRGPDGVRHWIAPDRHVALGHARLSIIDLTTGTNRLRMKTRVSGSSSTGSSTHTSRSKKNSSRKGTGYGLGPTARSRSTFMRSLALTACTVCAESSRL